MSLQPLQPSDIAFLHNLLHHLVVKIDSKHIHTTLNSFNAGQAFRRLSDYGCLIERREPLAFCLRRTDLRVWQEYLESPLANETTPPLVVRVYRQTASTQDIARRHPGGWFVAFADEQTAGRGRLGRSWVAPPESAVLMSMRWPCLLKDNALDTLTYRVAVAVAVTAEQCLDGSDHKVRIKWPNDILVDGRKLAGILIERADDAAIIGIGFNVSLRGEDLADLPDDLARRVTSLTMLGHPTDRLLVAARLIRQCYRQLSSPHDALVLDEWRSRSPLGYAARFMTDGKTIAGTVIDLDPEHGLIVRRDTGEVVHLPAATTSVVS